MISRAFIAFLLLVAACDAGPGASGAGGTQHACRGPGVALADLLDALPESAGAAVLWRQLVSEAEMETAVPSLLGLAVPATWALGVTDDGAVAAMAFPAAELDATEAQVQWDEMIASPPPGMEVVRIGLAQEPVLRQTTGDASLYLLYCQANAVFYAVAARDAATVPTVEAMLSALPPEPGIGSSSVAPVATQTPSPPPHRGTYFVTVGDGFGAGTYSGSAGCDPDLFVDGSLWVRLTPDPSSAAPYVERIDIQLSEPADAMSAAGTTNVGLQVALGPGDGRLLMMQSGVTDLDGQTSLGYGSGQAVLAAAGDQLSIAMDVLAIDLAANDGQLVPIQVEVICDGASDLEG